MMNRNYKDFLMKALIYLSSFFTVAILIAILIFVFYKGLAGINLEFLTNMWEAKTTYVSVEKKDSPVFSDDPNTGINEPSAANITNGTSGTMDADPMEFYVPTLGMYIAENESGEIIVQQVERDSALKKAVTRSNHLYEIKSGDILVKAGDVNFIHYGGKEAADVLNEDSAKLELKVKRPGGGILPMLISTFYIIVLSLAISAPIGILSALYLNEYAKKGRLLSIIRFAIQSLAGIPSIIFGLFGMLVFVQLFKMQYSILAGALTLSIILLPVIISTTEEALKAIPKSYRESSLGLGATKLQTNFRVVLPNAMPGILAAMLLSIGRIVGESAALIYTAGTIAQIPKALTGSDAGAATLTTKLYWIIKETGDMSAACSIAVILILFVFLLNRSSSFIANRYFKKKGI